MKKPVSMKRRFHGNSFALSFKIHHIMNRFRFPVQILHKSADSLFLVKFQMLRNFSPLILINNGKSGIQVSGFMKTAFYILLLETGFFKYFRIRQKVDSGAGLFTTVINNYARELGILKEKDSNFTGADVRNGLTAVISIKHPDPRFEGQTKTKLDNQDASRVTGKITGEEIQLYFDKNLENLKKVIACAEKAAKIRKSEEKAKTNLLTKQKFSFDSNGKLANCESRDASVCEIFIPSENPQPKALIMVLISALAKTLSILAFSTFRIFPRMGRIA